MYRSAKDYESAEMDGSIVGSVFENFFPLVGDEKVDA